MVRRLLRLAMRFAVSGFCLLSLLACLGVGWLWAMGASARNDQLRLDLSGSRYTLRSAAGRIDLRGPPAADGPRVALAKARQWVAGLRNDDFHWLGVVERRPNGVVEAAVVRPEPVPGWREWETGEFGPAQVIPPLLEALGDPERFAAADLMLRWATHWRGRLAANRGPDKVLYGLAGDTVDLTRPDPTAGWCLTGRLHNTFTDAGPARIDPAQLPAVRDYWCDRLGKRVASVPHWQLMAATALPPLLWLGARTRRALVLRGRRRLGLCLNCGYDLRGSRESGRCSECGEAVPTGTKGVAAR